jgi:putative DNA-invertase from lambdoid prophage Rac
MQNSIKVYGYLRVSTGKQEIENNKSAILLKANELKLGCNVEWIEEQISGTKHWANRELGKLIEIIKEGDIIITSEVSRFGRRYFDVVQFLAKCAEKKVKIYCTNSDLKIDDSIQSQMVIFAQSISAQIEREHISSRTKIALQRKKAEGVKLGRKCMMVMDKDPNNINKVKDLINKQVKLKAIAKEMKCTAPTLRAFIKKHNLNQ